MTDEHLGKEAERLLRDDVLNHFLDTDRAEALAALADANVDDKTSMLRLQQRVAAIDDIRSALKTAAAKLKQAISPAGTIA